MLVAPYLIKVAYIIGQIWILVWAAIIIQNIPIPAMGIPYGILILILGSISLRVICEAIIILFQMNDHFGKIKTNQGLDEIETQQNKLIGIVLGSQINMYTDGTRK